LYKENYYKGVEGFSNLIFSNPKNISEGEIRCSCVKCKNKKIHQADIVMMHLLKKVYIEILMLVCTRPTKLCYKEWLAQLLVRS
jgi:hypothetical protein